jgi:hypothetical protein
MNEDSFESVRRRLYAIAIVLSFKCFENAPFAEQVFERWRWIDVNEVVDEQLNNNVLKGV